MKHSEEIKDIAIALSKAQKDITGAKKDTDNSYFKSTYADLASVWDAVRKPLTDNNLAVVQTVDKEDSGFVLNMKLIHSSGQWFSSKVHLLLGPKQSMQALGSAITYARRYSLAAVTGVPQVDDDGNECSGSVNNKVKKEKNNQSSYKEKYQQNNQSSRPATTQVQNKMSTMELIYLEMKRLTDNYKDKDSLPILYKSIGIGKFEELSNVNEDDRIQMLEDLKGRKREKKSTEAEGENAPAPF